MRAGVGRAWGLTDVVRAQLEPMTQGWATALCQVFTLMGDILVGLKSRVGEGRGGLRYSCTRGASNRENKAGALKAFIVFSMSGLGT